MLGATARGSTLRSRLAAVTAVVTMLAFVVAAALVVLTTYLHQTIAILGEALESVRLAEEAEIDLLRHGSSVDPALRQDLERDLRRRLATASTYVSSAAEGARLREADERVRAYLDAPGIVAPDDARMSAAHAALEALVEVNVAQAAEARARADAWERMANAIGWGAGALLLALAPAIVWWLHRRAFRPLFELADVMERFGRGERSARAAETGPAELRHMAARFNEMADAAAARRAAQTAFLAAVAHDLRTPLSALRISVELLAPDRPLPPEERVRHTVALVRRQIERLERILADFLDMTKIEAGRLELCVERHDACRLVREVAELFAAVSPRHTIEVRVPPDPVAIPCDALRMEQVVVNLVSNAIKYSPAGGRVEVAVEALPGEAVIRVSDEGVGLSPEEERRLFEPFERSGPPSHAIPGAGLGLYVVRRLVDAHGGRVEVRSAPGRGSTFLVHLRRDSDGDGAPMAAPADA